MSRLIIRVATILSLCSLAIPVAAQATTGAVAQISGSVSDPSGAIVAGAQVKATQTNTGFSRTAVTGSDGGYVLPNLSIGPYELEVTSSGFNTYLQRGIILQVNDNVTVNVKLQVGDVTQNVEVNENASMVQMHSTSVSQVIEQRRLVKLPLNGRDVTQLLLLSGAAVTSNYGDFTSTKNYPTSHAVSVAGGQPNGTAYMLDGGIHMDLYGNPNLPLPFPDAVQEFSVQTSTISAQYGGQAGAVVNVATKSGANQIHGDVFEFLRNGAVNARNFFAASTDTLKRNQFGGTIGGPIKRDKLFFFGGYQGTRTRTTPPTSTFFVPTVAVLAGDFRALESAPCVGKPRTLVNPAGGTFAGNVIDPASFNPSAVQMIQKYMPPTGDSCGKILIGIPNPSNENQYMGRIDWIASTRNNFFGRYFNTGFTNPAFFDGKNLLQSIRTGIDNLVQAVTLGDTYTFTPNLVNTVHLTVNRERLNRGPADGLPSPASLGINMAPSPGNFPAIGVTGYFSTSCGVCSHAFVNRNVGQVTDNVIWIHGRHQLGFGGEYARMQMNFLFTTNASGSYSFNGSFTGDALADFLLGYPSSFSQGQTQRYSGRGNRAGLYLQDSFRASSRLTLMAGLRWDPYFPAYDISGRGGEHFDAQAFAAGQRSPQFLNGPPGYFFSGDAIPGYGTISKSGTGAHLRSFAPRIGLAWDPTGSGSWSLRASYGVFYDLPDMAYLAKVADSPPWGNIISLSSPSGGFSNPFASLPGGNPFPLPDPPTSDLKFPPAGIYRSVPLQIKPPYTQHWNFSIERQIGPNWLLSASYIGNKSTHRWINTDLNPAVFIPGTCRGAPCSTTGNTQARRVLSLMNPVAGALISRLHFADDGGNAQYNALLLKANHRFSENVSVFANYTWSHCLSEGQNVSTLDATGLQNPNDRSADRGNCVNDRRHLLNLSYVLTSPHFRGAILDKLFGNWEHGGIVGKQSGAWLTPLVGQDISLTGVGNDRPNLVGDPPLSNPTLQQWFNTSAYARQAPGTFGNAGPYSILGPGGFTFDAMLSRRFPIREGQNLEVRFEAFNVLNHPVFGNPGTNLASSSFGKILSASDPRILQFAIKYNF